MTRAACHRWMALGLLCFGASLAWAQAGDDAVLQARDALRKKDKAALAGAVRAVHSTRHPLALWVEYWELQNRLPDAQQPDLDAFYARWPGSYVEDRLRNDWLLELGRRRDWPNFRADFARFRMNDDREVTCYALLTQHLDGVDVRSAARSAWYAQRDLDDGCALLARTLFEARVFHADDAWQGARLAVENNRPLAARAAASLVNPAHGMAVAELMDDPVRWLNRKPAAQKAASPAERPADKPAERRELALLAALRMAANDPDQAAGQISGSQGLPQFPTAMAATAWAQVAKQSALRLQPQASEHARVAWKLWDAAHPPGTQPPWTDDLLAWHVRSALRQPAADPQRWVLVQRAIDAMSPAEQRDSAWVYWKARAQQARAGSGPDGDATRAAARQALESIAAQAGFYGKLAAEDLGGAPLPLALPALTASERDNARSQPGLVRALQLIHLGLRNEGVREWNYTLRGLPDRDLRAAAQLACDREVWDRCINTSERSKTEFDVQQRFPMPYRDQIVAQARSAGLDPALMFGLIRQESRFIADARSGVGAAGLMQLMPATARETAKKIGLPYGNEQVTDRDVNLRLGAAYLKRVLDDFGGSLAMAAAAYNAGPGRPRRWRESGTAIEPAAWAESIPFNETRDYVKKVLSNSVDYAVLLGAQNSLATTLKGRLGAAIGPRQPGAPAPDRSLP